MYSLHGKKDKNCADKNITSQEGGDICIFMTDSTCCMAETNTIL